MPLVTLTVRQPKSAEFRAAVLDAVHAALVSSGVPATDLFQRVLEQLGKLVLRRRPPHPHLTVAQEARFNMRTLTRVPRPGSLAICHSPPMALARWRMLASPNP